MSTWNMHDKEFESVVSLPAERRYTYFIKKVADWRLIWSLAADDGWVLAADSEGRQLVPVWPHPRFAAVCATNNWAGNEPRSIKLSDWLKKWIPGMVRDKRLVVAFPTPSGQGVEVSPEDLKDHLNNELLLYGE